MRAALDYRNSNGDTNYPDSDAVLPVTDGEAANQAILRRPTENVRNRSEVLRTFMREHAILQDNAQSGPLHGGGLITFDSGTGIFTTDNDMWVMPFGTTGTVAWPFIASTKASLRVGTPSNNELVFTSVKKQWQDSFVVASDANEISVEIVAGSSLTVTAKGASGYLNHIYITIVSGTTTCNDVITAVNAAVPTLVLASLGAGSTGTNAAALWGTAQWAGDYTNRFLKGGSSGVLHRIEPTAFDAFFAADPANVLKAGDTLAIWYDKNVDPTGKGGRLQSTVENANYNIPVGSLFNSTREPEKIPNSIPICKNIDGVTLLFADGSYIQAGIPAWLGADSWMLQNAHEAQIDTSSWYSDYFGIKKFSGGHGADPAVNIQQALDNTDEQVHAIWGHCKTFVSVSDGISSTGCQFNGANALYNALVYLDGLTGGTIFVRKGTYDIVTALAFSHPIHVVGVEEGVTISCQNPTDYAFTFNTGAEDSSFEHVRLVLDPSGTGLLVHVLASAITFKKVFSDGQFQIDSARCVFDQCYMQGPATIVLVSSTDADQLRITNSFITGTSGGGQEYFTMTANGSAVIDNTVFVVQSGHTAIITTDGLCTLSHVKVICSPFDPDWPVVVFGGGKVDLNNVSWRVSGTGDIGASLLKISSNAFTAKNLSFDMNSQRLSYTANNSPISFVSASGHVSNLTVTNAGLIPDTGTDGFSLPALVPFIRVAGSSGGAVTINTANISGLTRNPTPSGACTFYCMGDECSTFGIPLITNGRHILENVQIDFSDNTYQDAVQSVVAFAGIQHGSVYRSCKLILGSTGYLTMGWWALDVQGVTIDDCKILSATSGGLVGAIFTMSSSAGLNSWSIVNNLFKFSDLNGFGTGYLVHFAAPFTASSGHVISNNRIWNTSGTGAGYTMIKLEVQVAYSTIIGNSILKGNVANQGIVDSGSGNLWAGLNVVI